MPYKSRIPEISAALAARLEIVAAHAADEIVAKAKDRVPVGDPDVHLKDHIRKEHTGAGEYTVLAGDNQTFYGHIVEHGSVRAAPHPFLIPAAEEVRGNINSIARSAVSGL